ncbi:SirB2 family protein [Marinobacterium jannaschii]|uniref:SirB2 family protein n=1 Tax=Marinobacterium jannaschii TaxID=64970 RepID=UPI00047F086A|nr:SirB2 family protein [Marinobacterium jannaschii]
MSYLFLKHLHLTTVALSITLFLLRSIWMLIDSPSLNKRWVKIVPHIIDSVLLLSAIGLTIVLSQYPIAEHWLTAKVAGLIAYIVLGTIALKRGKTKSTRTVALAGALACLGYIIGVALSHSPLSWLAA